MGAPTQAAGWSDGPSGGGAFWWVGYGDRPPSHVAGTWLSPHLHGYLQGARSHRNDPCERVGLSFVVQPIRRGLTVVGGSPHASQLCDTRQASRHLVPPLLHLRKTVTAIAAKVLSSGTEPTTQAHFVVT